MVSDFTMRMIEQHLSELHRELWAKTTAELSDKLVAAVGSERAEVQRQFDAHYANRHRPETSRAMIVQQAEANAGKGLYRGR